MDALILAWITTFVSKNLVTITAVLVVLKEIARATPWATDDKIVQIVTKFFRRVKNPIPPKKE